MTRFIAIDYGTKRIGLAVGDDDAKIAMPLTTVETHKRAADTMAAILSAAAEYEPDEYIVGLPINMACSSSIISDRYIFTSPLLTCTVPKRSMGVLIAGLRKT